MKKNDGITWALIDAELYSTILGIVFESFKAEKIGIAQAIYCEGYRDAMCFNIE